MIRRLGICVASLAAVGACMAAAFNPHRAATPPTITESAVMAPIVSDAVLREPMIALHPLAAIYVIAGRGAAPGSILSLPEPIAETPAMRSLWLDRLRDNSSSTWRAHTCDGSSLCRSPTIGTKPIDLDRRMKDART